MADDKKKKQTPNRGKPRQPVPDAKDAKKPGTAGVQVPPINIYANDPGGDGAMTGFTDFREQRFRGGRPEYFVNGHGIDVKQTENKNFVGAVNRHERAMFGRMARAQEEDWDIARRAEKDRRYRQMREKAQQDRQDRNFKNAAFSSREGWANLGRASVIDDNGKEVKLGRGAEGVKDYDKRYGELKGKADKLTRWLAEGDFAGRGKEWEAIRKEVAKTHAEGGLTEKQLEGIGKKMDSLLAERNERADRANRLQAFYEKKSLQEQRKRLGDTAGILSDDQVREMSDRRKWDNIREASDAYLGSISQKDANGQPVDPDTNIHDFFADNVLRKNGNSGPADLVGTVARRGDRIDAMQKLLDNGISLTQMADMAVKSGEKKWVDAYGKAMALSGNSDRYDQAIENLGHDYLRSMLAKGDEGVKALKAGIAERGTVAGKAKKGPNKILSWDDPVAEPEAAPSSPGQSSGDGTPAAPTVSVVDTNGALIRRNAVPASVSSPVAGPAPSGEGGPAVSTSAGEGLKDAAVGAAAMAVPFLLSRPGGPWSAPGGVPATVPPGGIVPRTTPIPRAAPQLPTTAVVPRGGVPGGAPQLPTTAVVPRGGVPGGAPQLPTNALVPRGAAPNVVDAEYTMLEGGQGAGAKVGSRIANGVKLGLAADLAYAGGRVAWDQGKDFVDTYKATGANLGDVGGAVAKTFSTANGARNLGLGLMGSLADAGHYATFGALPKEGDWWRDKMR